MLKSSPTTKQTRNHKTYNKIHK